MGGTLKNESLSDPSLSIDGWICYTHLFCSAKSALFWIVFSAGTAQTTDKWVVLYNSSYLNFVQSLEFAGKAVSRTRIEVWN